MSSLPQRRESPRRRIRSGGMLPGYVVMFTAYVSGIATLSTMFITVEWFMLRRSGWDVIITGAIAVALLGVSAWKADRLRDTP